MVCDNLMKISNTDTGKKSCLYLYQHIYFSKLFWRKSFGVIPTFL